MKKHVTLICCIFFLLASGLANAQEKNKNLDVSIGFQTYYHEYKEPGLMKNEGLFYGISYSVLHLKNNILFGLEGLLSYGQVDYSSTSTGESDDIEDVCADNRIILGYVAFGDSTTRLIPFVGIAYRFLQDDSKYQLTSTNNIGYLRESNYFYSPVGLKMQIQYANGWALCPEIEYDYFWYGQQESYLGYVPGYEDMNNDQESGYGYRLSLTLAKTTAHTGYSIQVFYRYWDIDTSDIDIDRFGRVGVEPANETSEFGLNFSFIF